MLRHRLIVTRYPGVMQRSRSLRALVLVLFAAGLACSRPRLPGLPLDEVRLPPGFRIALYARVPGARSLALGKEGTVFVGTRERGGSVFAITDKDRDGKGEEVFTLGRGLMMPNGVAF